jgi:hypothetical protein
MVTYKVVLPILVLPVSPALRIGGTVNVMTVAQKCLADRLARARG